MKRPYTLKRRTAQYRAVDFKDKLGLLTANAATLSSTSFVGLSLKA
jgi:hypothetical protein